MKRKCTIRVAKTKALISFAVTAKLICVLVFAYAVCWFSHEAAQMTGENNNENQRTNRPVNAHLMHGSCLIFMTDYAVNSLTLLIIVSGELII